MATLPHYSNSRSIKVLMFGEVKLDHLRQHFSQFGEVSHISQPYFRPDQSTHSHGTYVTFKTSEAASVAYMYKDRNQKVEGFRIQVYRHSGPIDSTRIPVQTSVNVVTPEPKTVKVSMFNGQLTRESLCNLFGLYGEIMSLHVVTDGNPPYAYINFYDPDAAKRASKEVDQQSHIKYGVRLLARLASPKNSQPTRVTIAVPTATLPSANYIQYPPTWVLTPNVFKVELKRSSEEWNDIGSLFHATMPQAAVVSIDRIENKTIYDEYAHRMQKMQEKGKPLNEKKLFHGSHKTPPVDIYESDEGFDFRFSADGGLWGRGVYFAVKASFSNHYSYRDQKGLKQIFLASVLTGETCWMDKEDKSLTMPPLKPGSNKRYDSVSAHHSGGTRSDIFVVYKLDMAYPTHLITYTLA